MRALRFCGLTLAVAAAHLAAWQAAAPRPSRPVASAVRPRGEPGRVAWVAVAAASAAEAPGETPLSSRPGSLAARPASRAPPVPGRQAAAPPAPPDMRPEPARHAPATAGRAGPRWPVYATRPPPSAQLEYRLRQVNPRGALPDGHATLAWSRDAGAFSLRLAAALPGRPTREWLSEGGFDAAGVAPRRLAQLDGGRATRSVEFDPARAHVGPAGGPAGAVTAPGVQDRWSWIAQLAAIAEADARQLRVAHVQVAGLRGDLERWTFHAVPGAALPADAAGRIPAAFRAAPLLHLVKEAEHPFDIRIELWTSPATHHLPIALRLSTPPGRWSFEMWPESAGEAPGTP
jgi:hypothetical protein